jgi:thymidine phosphorylase
VISAKIEQSFSLQQCKARLPDTCVAQRAGRKTVAMLTSNDQPLGYAVGNAVELVEVRVVSVEVQLLFLLQTIQKHA